MGKQGVSVPGAAGFDLKALKALIAERKKDQSELAEVNSLLDLYRRALGG